MTPQREMLSDNVRVPGHEMVILARALGFLLRGLALGVRNERPNEVASVAPLCTRI